MFEDECKELYEVIAEAHEKYEQDLDLDTVFQLWRAKNPVATDTNISHMKDVVHEVDNSDMFSTSIAADLIQAAWKKEAGRHIAELGTYIIEGRDDAFNKLEVFIENYKDGFQPSDLGEVISKDINELLASTSNDNRWKFNIKALSDQVYGVGPGDFMIAFARPETGKTAFGVSIACGPDGFCAQGARVLYMGNEEDARRTMLRAYQSYSGMKREEIILNPEDAVKSFNDIIDNIDMIAIQDWFIEDIENYVRAYELDVLIVDQADKIKLHSDNQGHERLRDIYIQLRAIATKYEIAVIAICQSSVDGEHRTRLTADMMEGSKTGKYAEGDLIIGIGKYDDPGDGSPNEIRFLNICKNKINGFHGEIICRLQDKISRYVD